MSYPARVFRVLIASPSDVKEERKIVVKTIQEWNDLNSAERQVVLLPLLWESHSAPEYGARPQEVINNQVVDHCDLLVGIFWTRIGSPTGEADSGTLEEIERVANQNKPVMLYFSQVKQDPEQINLEQLGKLREFKKKTFPNALVESYLSQIEFRDKLSRQLEIQLRVLMAESGEKEGPAHNPYTDIQIHFADVESGEDIGSTFETESTLLNIGDFSSIPDYLPYEEESTRIKTSGFLSMGIISSVSKKSINKNYYRQLITYAVGKNFFNPLRFWLKNIGGTGAKDVYVDISVKSDSNDIFVILPSRLGVNPPSPHTSGGLLSEIHYNSIEDLFPNPSNSWSTNIELRALQPQREISPEVSIMLGAKSNCIVEVIATIYADTLPAPIKQRLKVNLTAKKIDVSANDIVEDIPINTDE